MMRKNLRYLLVIVGLAVLSLMIMDFNNRINEMGRLEKQREGVAAQVTQLSATNQQLQNDLAYATSEAAVLEQAYGQEKMVRPNDVLIVPLPGGGPTPEPTPIPQQEPVQFQYWQYWLALFLD